MQLTKALLASLLALATVASAAAGAPVGTAQAVAEPAVHVPPVPLLWKVSDGDNALYLLGSFHLLKGGDYPLSTDIDRAFAAAEKVVFEIPPEALLDPTTGQRFLDAAAYDDDRSLSDVLSPRMRKKLQQLIARQGGSIARLEDYEPWFVNLSLLMGLSQSLGFSAEMGLDRHLMARAADAAKPTAGLESFDDQLRALDSAPMDEQVIGLAEFIDRPREMPGVLDDLHRAWREGDIEGLDRLTRVEMMEQTPETYRIVNVERNEAWLPKLRAMLDDNPGDDILVVVGALHLLGGDGVVAMLRDKGYAVERICSACEVAVGDD